MSWAIAFIATVTVLETAHVVSPLILAWSHPGLRAIVRREWVRHILMPPMMIVIAVLAPLQYVAGLYFAWNIFHFGMQNYGVTMLCTRNHSPESRARKGLLCLAVTTVGMFVLLITTSPVVFAIGTVVFSFNHWLVDIGLSSWVSRRAWAFIAIVLTIGVAWLLLRQGPLSVRVLPSIIAFRYGIGFVHFMYSARIWRLSDPQVRAAIGPALAAGATQFNSGGLVYWH